MLSSRISPLGQTQGDSDRYLPAVLYGCVPVFTCDGEEGPFDEVIQWNRISISVKATQIPHLHWILANYSHEQVVRMRTAMRRVWPRLLWTGGAWGAARRKQYGRQGYLGESSKLDALSTMMQVLRQRLRLPPHAMQHNRAAQEGRNGGN